MLSPAKTPLAGDKINAPAACAVPFRPYCGGVVTPTRNVSQYMLVLALCLARNSGALGVCEILLTSQESSWEPL